MGCQFAPTSLVSLTRNTQEVNKRYQELKNRLVELDNLILEKLPEEFKYLSLDYEDAEEQFNFIIRKNIYRHGVADGIRIGKL
ncbi:MAG TPA: hypothetical protein VF941_18420, partial [Clostridia bacterium]